MATDYQYGFEIVSDSGSTMLGGSYHSSVVVNFDRKKRLFEVVGEGECTWGGTDIDNVEDLLNITTKAAGPFCVDWSDLLDGVKRLDDEFGEQLEIWMEKLSNEDENIPDSQLDDGSPEPVQAAPNDSSSASSQAEPKENPSPSQAPAEPGSNAEKCDASMRRTMQTWIRRRRAGERPRRKANKRFWQRLERTHKLVH